MRKSLVALQFSLVLVIAVALPKPGSIRGFDPQPEPPAYYNAAFGNGLDEVGLNPQPEPPSQYSTTPGNGFSEVGFNPQPDPPHDPFRIAGRLGDGSV